MLTDTDFRVGNENRLEINTTTQSMCLGNGNSIIFPDYKNGNIKKMPRFMFERGSSQSSMTRGHPGYTLCGGTNTVCM